LSIDTVTVYCASSRRSDAAYRDAARRLGETLAAAGITIVCGGGGVGSMGALADGALSRGGRIEGVLPRFMFDLEWAHPRLTDLHVVSDMHERKRLMLDRADAVVALPGGCGTLEELFEAITWKRLGLFTAPIVLINTRGFFDPCLALLERCVAEHFMDDRHRAMWSVVAEPEAVLDAIRGAPAWTPAARTFAVP
jgi:uncharacterized protein (TIGR00730 family)